MDRLSLILTLAIITGQFVKLPLGFYNSGTVLDLVVIIFCAIGLHEIKFRLKNPPIFLKAFLLFNILGMISLILTPLKLEAFEYFISFSYTIRLFFYILFGMIIYSGGLSKIKKNVISILLFAGVIFGFIGLLQLIFFPNLGFLSNDGWDPHYFRTVSTFFDPNFAGGLLVLTLILIIQHGKNILKGKLWLTCFIVVYTAFITTFSRSSALMMTLSFLSMSIFQKSKNLFLLTLIMILGFVLSFLIYTETVSKPRGISREKSAESRLGTWQQGFELLKKSPIFGVGFNSYRYGLRQFNLASKDFLNQRGSSTNDSSLLFVATTTGIFGFLAYLSFICLLIITAFKNYVEKNNFGLVIIVAVSGLLVHSLFANSLFYPPILLWIILAISQLKL